MMKIIGLSGTNGSGKDTVAHLLVREYGYYFASATDMLRDELERRGLPTDRAHKAELSAEWRRQYGAAALVDRAYEEAQQSHQNDNGFIVGSLRHPGEADRIHELGGIIIWTDADPKIRYDRIQSAKRGRAEDDKTFEEFLADEEREMHPEGDHATLNMSAVKDRADVVIQNNSNDVATFEQQVKKVLGLK